MFRIVCDPSSGSIELYLTEIRGGSQIFVVCLVGVCQRNFEPVVCVCTVRRAGAIFAPLNPPPHFKIMFAATAQLAEGQV